MQSAPINSERVAHTCRAAYLHPSKTHPNELAFLSGSGGYDICNYDQCVNSSFHAPSEAAAEDGTRRRLPGQGDIRKEPGCVYRVI